MNRLVIIILLVVCAAGCKSPEARIPISVKSGSFIDDSVKRNIELLQKEQDQIQKIIQNNPDKSYIASESGFWYYYNSKIEQDTITAKFGDIVNFEYNIKDFNDNAIYSNEDIGPQEYAMDQEELFTGLREGLKLMKPSETVTFLFPSQKAYGYYGDSDRIGANTPLVCEVTVHSISQNLSD